MQISRNPHAAAPGHDLFDLIGPALAGKLRTLPVRFHRAFRNASRLALGHAFHTAAACGSTAGMRAPPADARHARSWPMRRCPSTAFHTLGCGAGASTSAANRAIASRGTRPSLFPFTTRHPRPECGMDFDPENRVLRDDHH